MCVPAMSKYKAAPDESRWYITHSLGHKMMHPGNHLWIYQNTMLGYRYEREANDFAYALLMDAREAVREGLTCSWEVADHFGVPDRTALLQAPLVLE